MKVLIPSKQHLKVIATVLRDGKFYRDEKEVPPTFGDREQKDLVRRAAKEAVIAEKVGACVALCAFVSLEATYNCCCGNCFRFSTCRNEDMFEATCSLDGQIKTCKCGRKYQISDDEEWRVKQIGGPNMPRIITE